MQKQITKKTSTLDEADRLRGALLTERDARIRAQREALDLMDAANRAARDAFEQSLQAKYGIAAGSRIDLDTGAITAPPPGAGAPPALAIVPPAAPAPTRRGEIDATDPAPAPAPDETPDAPPAS